MEIHGSFGGILPIHHWFTADKSRSETGSLHKNLFVQMDPTICSHLFAATVCSTLQGTNISPKNGILEDDFPNFPRWDMYPFPGGYLKQLVHLPPTWMCQEVSKWLVNGL